VQPARDAQPGLIEVDQRPGAQLGADGVGEPTRDGERGGGAGDQGRVMMLRLFPKRLPTQARP